MHQLDLQNLLAHRSPPHLIHVQHPGLRVCPLDMPVTVFVAQVLKRVLQVVADMPVILGIGADLCVAGHAILIKRQGVTCCILGMYGEPFKAQ